MRFRSTRNERFARRKLALWIALALGALIAATIKARRIFGSTDDIFRSTDDGPLYTSDQVEPLQTELEGAAAAHAGVAAQPNDANPSGGEKKR